MMKRYLGERENEYLCRLIYSGLVQWMKVSMLDSDNFYDLHMGNSKNYIFRRNTGILQDMLDVFPECYLWFWSDYNDEKKEDLHPVKIIRERLLNSGEIIETDFNTSVNIVKEQKELIDKLVVRVIGNVKTNLDLKSVGITKIITTSDKQEVCNAKDLVSAVDFLEWLLKAAKWDKISNANEIEFFFVSGKESPYKSWQDRIDMTDEITLGRIRLFNDLYEYYLVKYIGNQLYGYKLNETLIEYKEYRRVILGLRQKKGNSITAQVEKKENVYLLKLFCRLPLREEIELETFCWPRYSITDKINYVVSDEIWRYIKRILETTGIQVKE